MELIPVQQRIYEIRGRQVMLDFDLAQLYQIENRALKQAVRRNIERFPADFMFKLSAEEANSLISMGVSHSVIPPSYNVGASEVFAFTQEGVAMLSGVLRSPIAVQVNIEIMRAFVTLRRLAMSSVEIRQLALENKEIRMLLDEFIEETEGKFDDVYVAPAKMAVQKQLDSEKPRIRVRGFEAMGKE